jgi:hypothetical protein
LEVMAFGEHIQWISWSLGFDKKNAIMV